MSQIRPTAFLALWNSISNAALQQEYETWHTFEHVPERVGLPGFIEARRYRSMAKPENPPDYFTCYWLNTLQALNSPEYSELFACPTPWSARMRVELRNFFRLPCTLSGTYGQSMASQLATVHFRGEANAFAEQVSRELTQRVDTGDVLCAHWGTVAQTAAIPLGNRASAPAVASTGSDFVVMLQGLDAGLLREQTDQLLHALVPVAVTASAPEFFELLSQVRQSELVTPTLSPQGISQRQAPRTDLFQKFQTGDNP